MDTQNTPEPQETPQPTVPPTQEQPVEPPPQVDSTERLLSALGYVGFLCVLPLVLRRDSKFCTYHGKQGLVIAVADMGLRLLSALTAVYTIILVLLFGLMAYCIIRAYRGEIFSIPLVSDLASQLKL